MQVSANGIVYANSTLDSGLVLSTTAGSLITVLDGVLLTNGWSKAFSGTNKAAYRSDDITGTRRYLRVDDTGTTNARVCGYESMDGIDTVTPGYALFPTEAQLSGGGYVWKTNAGTRAWSLFTDGRILYFFCDTNGNGGWLGGFMFGEGVSYLSPDPFNAQLCASTTVSTNYPFASLTNASGASSYGYIARSYSQVLGSVGSYRYSHGRTLYMGDTGQAYPAPVGSAFHAWPVEYWEGTTVARGLFPGLWNPIHDSEPPHGTQITDIPQLPDRTLVVQAINTARVAIDITGPWR